VLLPVPPVPPAVASQLTFVTTAKITTTAAAKMYEKVSVLGLSGLVENIIPVESL